MSNGSLSNEILVMIKHELNTSLPINLLGSILKDYGNSYVDVKLTNNGSILKYVKCIGNRKIGRTGIVLFLDGDDNSPVFITSGADGGTVDLSDYVKKEDVSFTVSLEDNGTMIFNLGVGE